MHKIVIDRLQVLTPHFTLAARVMGGRLGSHLDEEVADATT